MDAAEGGCYAKVINAGDALGEKAVQMLETAINRYYQDAGI
ncbi:phosphoenolpyruvate carboxykinase (ATP) [Ruminococcaceae bacterium OttesenSCG-928-I18]|nr:phosphoenolpyruvate carboxykinase (ATP) [Ruminococcaceae bacterium OttesenSCG-928-I18]